MDLDIQETGLGTEHGCGFRLGDQSQSVVILVAQEAGLNGGGTRCGLARIVPDGRHGQVVSDVTLLSVEHLTQRLLQLVAHGLSQVEKVIGGDIDLRLARG